MRQLRQSPWFGEKLGALIFAVSLLASPAVQAGKSCGESTVDATELMQALELAEQTRQVMLKTGASTAIIARVGQDLSGYGLRYSHLGMLYQTQPGQFSVLHELNECGSDQSGLYREGLGNFFLDDVFAFEVLILIPPVEAQPKIQQLLQSEAAIQTHHSKYNMLAYPFDLTYQNSNQWGLELLSHVLSPTALPNRKAVQQWLQQQKYQPGVIEVGPLSRIGATMFRSNVSFTEHPLKQRLSGAYQVVTVESVDSFLQQQWPTMQRQVLKLTSTEPKTQ
ncbi:MAG: DUF2145 domain-containing protein [Gammaproteobacteria bacterium]|nr:DUF2145 domain-containing protein [Gammaproteobacteria bacterium]